MRAWWQRMRIWATIALLLHFLFQQYLLPQQWNFFWTYPSHLLLWALTYAEHRIALRLQAKQSDQLGMAFMAGGMVKFFIGILYLLPFILNKGPMTQPVALWFFLPYFTSMAFQAKETIKLLQKPL